MKENEFLLLLDELLEQEPGSVRKSDTLESIGWNSLAVLGLMGLADERFGVSLQPSKIAACKSVTDLLELVGVRNN